MKTPQYVVPVRFLNPLLKLGCLTGRTDEHFVDTATQILIKYAIEQQDLGRKFEAEQKGLEEGPAAPSVDRNARPPAANLRPHATQPEGR